MTIKREAVRAAGARKSFNASIAEIVDFALRGVNDINVVVGPLAWQSVDGTVAKRWYFMLATCEPERGLRCVPGIVSASQSAHARRPPLRFSVVRH